MDYYDKGILCVIGSQIGRVLKVDVPTLKCSKGKFARICIELDLSKPLLPLILINGKEKRVEYEGIHLICFSCGRYGHNRESCPLRSADGDKSSVGAGRNDGFGGVQMHSSKVPENFQQSSGNVGLSSGNQEGSVFGDWMTVQRGRFRRGGFRGTSGEKIKRGLQNNHMASNTGSRFATLSEEVIEVNEAVTTGLSKNVPVPVLSNVTRAKKSGPKIKGAIVAEKSKEVIKPNKLGAGPMDIYLIKKKEMSLFNPNLVFPANESIKIQSSSPKSHSLMAISDVSGMELEVSDKELNTQNLKGSPIDPGDSISNGLNTKKVALFEADMMTNHNTRELGSVVEHLVTSDQHMIIGNINSPIGDVVMGCASHSLSQQF